MTPRSGVPGPGVWGARIIRNSKAVCVAVTSRMFITACKAVNYRVILTQLVTF